MYKENYTKTGVILFFIALLLTPAGIRQLDKMRAAEVLDSKEETIERYGFYLEDFTKKSGINFVHQRADVDEQLHHILPQISSVGASVSIVDINKNGLPDIYLTNSKSHTHNALYKNNGDGTFTDIANELGIADVNHPETGASMGAVWGDFNNNGYEDLFLYKWGRQELFLNDEGRGFINITEQAGLPEWANVNSAIWLDYNNNGLLDLFIAGYFHEDVNFWNLETTRIMPDSYEYATNGGRNYLYENQGGGTFIDVTEQTGLDTRRWTLAVAAGDLNDNGYPDLFLANDYGADELFLNEGGRFRLAGDESGIGFVPKSGMSVAFGDIMNQGRFSIYVTNISEAAVLMQGNNLWVPSRGFSSEHLRYRNMAANMGVEVGDWGYGGQFIDFNNNGNLDLYVANGFVSDEPDTDYWYDYAKVVGGNRNIIIDARNWPAMNGRTFSGYQANKLWLNDGAGRFREAAAAVNADLRLDSRAIAYADLFGNGALDMIVANQNGPVVVLKNHVTPEHNWIAFSLQGTRSNTSAIGAVLKLHWDGKIHKRTIHGGDAFASQSQRPVHFGIGSSVEIEKIEIFWPGGAKQTIMSPQLNSIHTIIEELES